jgi:hypothetical protein
LGQNNTFLSLILPATSQEKASSSE